MIAAMMAYTFVVALLLSLAALAAERMAAIYGGQRRIVWSMAISASLAIPCAALLVMQSDAGASDRVAGAVTSPSVLEQTVAAARVAFSWAPMLDWPVWSGLDAVLIGLWGLASVGMLLVLAATFVQLHTTLRRAPTLESDGKRVSIADDIGPAVFGFLDPRIIVPRWLLTAPSSVRSVALQHEQMHISARDPMLYLTALLLVSLAPWNAPLWWQLRRLRFAIEVDCDARVLRSGLDPAIYGETLLAVSQSRSPTPFAAMAMGEPASQLERRIKIMLLEKPRRYLWAGIGFLALAAAPAVYAAALQPPNSAQETAECAAPRAGDELHYQADRLQWLEDRGVLILEGDVCLRASAATVIDTRSDRVSDQGNGARLFEGAVTMRTRRGQITAERAVIMRAANGDTLVRTDRAEVTAPFIESR